LRTLLCSVCFFIVITPAVARTELERSVSGERPNIVFFFVDDMGGRSQTPIYFRASDYRTSGSAFGLENQTFMATGILTRQSDGKIS